jgi:hypothetical protein
MAYTFTHSRTLDFEERPFYREIIESFRAELVELNADEDTMFEWNVFRFFNF